MAKDEKGTVYVLSISLNKQKYYVSCYQVAFISCYSGNLAG